MLWWVLALLAAGLFLYWYIGRVVTRKSLVHAAAYAGYTLDDLLADRAPSCREVVMGIRRQPERLAQRAAFLAARLESAMPTYDRRFLENCRPLLDAFLAAAEEGRSTKASRSALYDLGKHALVAGGQQECPAELRSSLVAWAVDIPRFVHVVRTFLTVAKSCKNCNPETATR